MITTSYLDYIVKSDKDFFGKIQRTAGTHRTLFIPMTSMVLTFFLAVNCSGTKLILKSQPGHVSSIYLSEGTQ